MVKVDRREEATVRQLTGDLSPEDLAFFLRISQTMIESIEQHSTAITRTY